MLLLGLKRLSWGLVGGHANGYWWAAEGFMPGRRWCRGAGNWRSVPGWCCLLLLFKLLVEQLTRGGLRLLHVGLLQGND